jgi:HlyD family secretion protein
MLQSVESSQPWRIVMAKKKKIFLIVAAAVVVVAALLIFVSMKKKGNPSETVQTAQVGRQKIVQTVTATGKIQPRTQVKISADVAAKIIRLPVKEGQWVNAGDLLVELDRERYSAAAEQAEANLRSIEANAWLARESTLKAEKDYGRTKELFEKNLESQALYDQAYSAYQIEKARYQSALENVDQAKASVKEAKDNLSKTTIRAPMSGTISELNKEAGEIALGSQFQEDVIMVISNLSGMEALVDVDENDVINVSIGDSARIEVDALPDKVFKGTVTEIASSAKVTAAGTTEQKTEFEVKIGIIDPGTDLRPGMTASGDIITETKDNALGIPIQCVSVRTMDQLKTKAAPESKTKPVAKAASPDSTKKVASKTDSATVAASKPDSAAIAAAKPSYVPDKDGFVQVVFVVEKGLAKAKQVKTGIQSETHIEILEGLSEGDTIVTGSFRAISQTLQNDAPVLAGNPGQK